MSDTHIIAHNSPVLKPRSDIEALIISKAVASQVSPELLLRVARCESGFKPSISNPRSTASGLFQFLDSTFLRYAQAYELPTDNKNDPSIQAELAAKMIADGGIEHWNASRSCWE
ncbi:transglycosylase SLT domain-containing protein [Candidatus Woesearchaeota archaeon]|nr:transglycosylase SLT domain-containing protein [Candidatus Woesearchaeota archaeon]